jgi:hypothetical protein
MTDRNWDAEMAKIDRQLASISDDQLVSRKPIATAPVAATSLPAGASAPVARTGRVDWGVALRVGLGVVLGAAILFWPYASSCGLGLGGYLGATLAVIAAGVWGAVSAWRARAPRAHILAILVVLWGASLAAREVLPRVGHAREVRAWACK